MDAFSLLCCKSTERHDELKIWLYVALAAMAFVIFDKEAELIMLEFAFVAALCLRQGAVIAARSIRKSVNVITAIGLMARAEGRLVQRCAAGIGHVTAITARRRALENRQASFSSLGLPHPGLTARLLPQPVSFARQ